MELAVKEAERERETGSWRASTITNQCARSIFLWQGRSWIRKGLESDDTIWMEILLPKRRIMELYAERDRDGGFPRGRSSFKGLSGRQRAWSYAETVGHAGGSPAESERLGSDEAEQDVAMASAAHSAT